MNTPSTPLVTYSIQHGPRHIESAKLTGMEQVKFFAKHLHERKHDTSWRIINEVTGEILDSYTPQPKPARSKPTCGYKGSWAEEMALKRQSHSTTPSHGPSLCFIR